MFEENGRLGMDRMMTASTDAKERDGSPWEGSRSVGSMSDGSAVRSRFIAFNTFADIALYAPPDSAQEALDRLRADCCAYERLFSRTLPDSDIGRLNAAAGEAVAIDPRTAEVLLAAKRYCEASEGTFDVTVGPLVALWDFKEGIVADPTALKEATEHVGWRMLDVWAQCGGSWFARLSDPKAAVDLGGIAKGWIADSLGKRAAACGACGGVVNLGGNVVVFGSKPDGSPWRVGIRDPRPAAPASAPLPLVELAEGSVVTSGVYERAFERDGKRYHHVLDPRTGMPIDTPWASVSVVARRSIDAEGFSTTLLALGLERSRTLARAHPEILQAYFVREDGSFELLRP